MCAHPLRRTKTRGLMDFLPAPYSRASQPIAKAGFLAKTGGTVKSVKRRWFVLRGNLLSYFQTENDKERTCRVVG